MRKGIFIILLCIISQPSLALKEFQPGQILTAQDLNDNFKEQSQRITQIEQKTGTQATFTRLLTGSGTIAASSAMLTGVNTLFSKELNIGDALKIGAEIHVVVSISSDTELSLGAPHTEGALNAQLFADADLLNINSGAGEERFVIDPSGFAIRKVARATGNGPVETGSTDRVGSRTLKILKRRNDTAIRISYTDNFSLLNVIEDGSSCRWEIRANGAACPDQPLVYDVNITSIGGTYSRKSSNTVVGYCRGLSNGPAEIQIWTDRGCHTGELNSTWVLEAEEVF